MTTLASESSTTSPVDPSSIVADAVIIWRPESENEGFTAINSITLDTICPIADKSEFTCTFTIHRKRYEWRAIVSFHPETWAPVFETTVVAVAWRDSLSGKHEVEKEEKQDIRLDLGSLPSARRRELDEKGVVESSITVCAEYAAFNEELRAMVRRKRYWKVLVTTQAVKPVHAVKRVLLKKSASTVVMNGMEVEVVNFETPAPYTPAQVEIDKEDWFSLKVREFHAGNTTNANSYGRPGHTKAAPKHPARFELHREKYHKSLARKYPFMEVCREVEFSERLGLHRRANLFLDVVKPHTSPPDGGEKRKKVRIVFRDLHRILSMKQNEVIDGEFIKVQ
ncbi:hypothetical protein BJ508DRAFT_334402 [Ascobolus immersus RN42]|uniref:Uncharacterized protein n=1 Tax=Ascobolus immersus RN42 TaxID=1160509 RepID=A0A3N4HGA5_ASCIM|nr:hypothetical protein BJ508DRAFT_334402 [Ascobolus immersus RN42]